MEKIKRVITEVFKLMKYRNNVLVAIKDTEIRILNDALSDGIVRPYNIELLKKYQQRYHLVDDTLIFI
jgi:cell division septal protein FtsQ